MSLSCKKIPCHLVEKTNSCWQAEQRRKALIFGIDQFENQLYDADSCPCFNKHCAPETRTGILLDFFLQINLDIVKHINSKKPLSYGAQMNSPLAATTASMQRQAQKIFNILRRLQFLARQAKTSGFSLDTWDEFIAGGMRLLQLMVVYLHFEERCESGR